MVVVNTSSLCFHFEMFGKSPLTPRSSNLKIVNCFAAQILATNLPYYVAEHQICLVLAVSDLCSSSSNQTLPLLTHSNLCSPHQVVATISGNSKLDKQGFLPIGSSLPDVTAQITANGITIDDAQNSGLHFVLKTARVISQHSKMTIYGELFLLAGVAATICLTTTLIATMPSVAKKLNW